MTLAFWLDVHWLRNSYSGGVPHEVGFIALYFFGLITGALPAILFAWLLRRSSRIFPSGNLWMWMAAGAGISFLLIWISGGLLHLARDPRYLPYSALPIWPFLIAGPGFISEGHIWVSVPAGAATAGILRAVHRAFAHDLNS